jgi:hypothetical protein
LPDRGVLKDLARVQTADCSGGSQILGVDGRMEFAQGAVPPGEDVLAVDDILDSDCCRLRDRAVFHGCEGCGR